MDKNWGGFSFMLIKFQLFRAPVESAEKCCAIPNKKQLHLFEIAIDFTRHRKIQSWPREWMVYYYVPLCAKCGFKEMNQQQQTNDHCVQFLAFCGQPGE